MVPCRASLVSETEGLEFPHIPFLVFSRFEHVIDKLRVLLIITFDLVKLSLEVGVDGFYFFNHCVYQRNNTLFKIQFQTNTLINKFY